VLVLLSAGGKEKQSSEAERREAAMLWIKREKECPSIGSMSTLITMVVSLTGTCSPIVKLKAFNFPDQGLTRKTITVSSNRRTQLISGISLDT